MSQKLLIALLISFFFFTSCKKDKLHWQQVERIETNTTDRLNEILFIDNQNAVIAGGERFEKASLLTSHDGGNTWQSLDFPEAGKGMYGLALAPSGTVYACGFDGKLLSSADKGNTWQFQQLALWQSYKDLAFFGDKGTIIGGISYYTGWLGRLDGDAKMTGWDSLAYELNAIETVNSTTGYICGFGVVMKTTDAGDSWHLLNVKNDNFTNMHISGSTIYVCGYNGSVFRSPDGGNNWERLRNGNDITLPRYYLLDILFTDAMNGWAVGEGGLVIYTDDGGNHWMEYDRFTESALRDITIAPDGSLMVIGDNGTLYRLKAQQ